MLSCGNNLLTCGNDLISCGNDLLTCGNELGSCDYNFLTCGNDLVSCGNENTQYLNSGNMSSTSHSSNARCVIMYYDAHLFIKNSTCPAFARSICTYVV